MNNPTDRVDIYDISTGEWDTASLSDPRCSQKKATTLNGLAYFTGGGNFMGSGYYGPSDVIDIYNPLENSWSTEYLSEPGVAHSVLSAGNFLVVAGGETNGGVVVSLVELLDTTGVGVPEKAKYLSAVKCFPNPTSGTTEFLISNFDYQQVSLSVFNAQGQRVAIVMDETLPAGEYTVRWDAGALPAGIYYYRFEILRTSSSGQADDQRLTTSSGKLVKY